MIQNFLGEQQDEQGTERTVDKRPDEGSKQVNGNGRESTSSSRENITPTLRGVPEVSAPETRLYPNYSIQQGDFLDWAKNYSGRPFNLLHLDFPYGINHDRSKQGNTKTFGTYSDTEDIYKTLVRGLLENQDHLVGESAHCICWLSLRFAEWTKKEFESAGWTCLLQPFIWHKSDNKGIIADTMCGMRNVGEYALVFIRGRRPVIKNISNIFPHPTTKVFHASEKPRAMLEYLYEAFCDKHTRLLDPTCGSGTSIQAALRYDVEEALGIELDEEFAEKAQTWLEGAKKDYSLKDIDLDIDL